MRPVRTATSPRIAIGRSVTALGAVNLGRLRCRSPRRRNPDTTSRSNAVDADLRLVEHGTDHRPLGQPVGEPRVKRMTPIWPRPSSSAFSSAVDSCSSMGPSYRTQHLDLDVNGRRGRTGAAAGWGGRRAGGGVRQGLPLERDDETTGTDGVRSYVSEPRRPRRRWDQDRAAQQPTYANRRRINGVRGKRLQRRRGELLERSFAHLLETGGMRPGASSRA